MDEPKREWLYVPPSQIPRPKKVKRGNLKVALLEALLLGMFFGGLFVFGIVAILFTGSSLFVGIYTSFEFGSYRSLIAFFSLWGLAGIVFALIAYFVTKRKNMPNKWEEDELVNIVRTSVLLCAFLSVIATAGIAFCITFLSPISDYLLYGTP